MKPTLVVMVAGDGTHAARPGDHVALCGQPGRGLLTVIRSSFDIACLRCARKVIDLLGLTPLTDPGNGDFRVVEEGDR